MAFVTPIIKKASKFVKAFLNDKLARCICYHNETHTREVVKATEIIGKASNLSPEEMEIVTLAAWFHDTGYYKGKDNHEEESALIAERFLKKEFYPADKIMKIKGCIKATKVPQMPQNLLEEVLCDADLSHLATATDKFLAKTELLKNEFCAIFPNFDSENWISSSCSFVQHHEYFTSYAQKNLKPIKEQNLDTLKSILNTPK